MTKVKICGITNLEDARASVGTGADALGFVFYKKSPRYITPQKARDIIKQIPKNIIKVGVFVNARQSLIKHIAKFCGLDILQFHGNESPEFCKKFKGYKVIKAFRVNPVRDRLPKGKRKLSSIISNGVKNKIDLKNILRYRTFAYLFDTFVKSKIGGTGKRFNWHLLTYLDNIDRPIFLSGGLNEKNVKEAIKCMRPSWVDVSSSVEIKPGQKDHKKIKEFIKVAKSTKIKTGS